MQSVFKSIKKTVSQYGLSSIRTEGISMQSQEEQPILSIERLNVWYGKKQILKDLTFDIYPKQVTAFIGPSKCGKTAFVRCLNRLNDLQHDFRYKGNIRFNGNNINDPKTKSTDIAQKIGMIFPKPIPLQRSIYEDVAYSARIRGIKQPERLGHIVERSLSNAQLWDEAAENLDASPKTLSIGQQQWLCIARALAANPDIIIIFDEPCEQLDAAETPKLEAIIQNLKSDYTIIFVTNKRRQAARVSDVAGFLYDGELVEYGQTEEIFTNPKDERTENYVTGRLG